MAVGLILWSVDQNARRESSAHSESEASQGHFRLNDELFVRPMVYPNPAHENSSGDGTKVFEILSPASDWTKTISPALLVESTLILCGPHYYNGRLHLTDECQVTSSFRLGSFYWPPLLSAFALLLFNARNTISTV